MFLALIPALTISFFMYGIYPRICKWMGLVAKNPPPVLKPNKNWANGLRSTSVASNQNHFMGEYSPVKVAVSPTRAKSPSPRLRKSNSLDIMISSTLLDNEQ